MEQERGIIFDTVGAVVMPGYPRDPNWKMPSIRFAHISGSWDQLAGYWNPLYLNRFFMEKSIKKAAKTWLKTRYHAGGNLDIFIYEMRSACINAAVYIKEKVPQAKIHLIIPDLPCFMDLNMGKLKSLLKKIDWHQMISRFDRIDDFILYAETMTDYLPLAGKKWMRMEGSISQEDIQEINLKAGLTENSIQSSGKKIILYFGRIDEQYGIASLVQAMDYLDASYELWVTGGGPYGEQLSQIAKKTGGFVFDLAIENPPKVDLDISMVYFRGIISNSGRSTNPYNNS